MTVTRISAEDILNTVYNILKNNLNTYITAQNTERNDSITLAQVPTTGFFFQDIPNSVNVNPWVLTTISSPIKTEMKGMSFSSTFEIMTILSSSKVLSSLREEYMHRSFMRYTEAISRCIRDNFEALTGYSLLEITQVPQAAEVQTDSGESVKVAGVILSTVIG